ncbi:MAG: hypothetical protein ACJA09_000340 [Alcanivorax sp.]|jgi:uncharacterized protein (DUF885 family)
MNRTPKLLALLCAGALILTACSKEDAVKIPATAGIESAAVPALQQTATVKFRVFLDENYAVDMARYPYSASYRGDKSQHDKWNSEAESFLQESREIDEARLAQLAAFDMQDLEGSLALSMELYQLDLERNLSSDNFRHHHPIITQHRGPHTSMVSNLINIHQVNDVADAEAYIGRLEKVGIWFDQVIEQMRIRQQKNFLLANWQYPKIIQASQNVIVGAPYDKSGQDSSLWADIQEKIAALNIAPEQQEQLLQPARAALLNVVKPAYERLIAELELQSALASDADGVWKFDNGDAFYAELLRWYTTTDLSAEEVHNIGLREVERIHGEMQAIMDQVEFKGSLADFFLFIREEPRFYYPDTDEGKAQYLAEAVRLIDVIREDLPTFFGLLPKAELVVKRVESFREQSAGTAFYNGPPADGSRPGIYYANLYRMSDMPKYKMEALAYHEGVPGHHMQRAISAELTAVPDFQKYIGFTAYTEGWGLYSELLAKDMGYYTDPYADFGRLTMELWRGCRLVVDTGIHSKRWTRKAAIDYLVENTPSAVTEATKAIERYIAMPGQATAYMIGKMKILELREKARAELGEDFDIRQFHDIVLKDGAVPLSILERKIDEMIAEVKSA